MIVTISKSADRHPLNRLPLKSTLFDIDQVLIKMERLLIPGKIPCQRNLVIVAHFNHLMESQFKIILSCWLLDFGDICYCVVRISISIIFSGCRQFFVIVLVCSQSAVFVKSLKQTFCYTGRSRRSFGFTVS